MAQCHLYGWVRLFFVCLSSLALLSGCQPLGILNGGLNVSDISIGDEISIGTDSIGDDVSIAEIVDGSQVTRAQTSSRNEYTLSYARFNVQDDLGYDDTYLDDDYADEYGLNEEEDSRRFLEEFERTHMVHRRAIFDIRGGALFPIDPDIDPSFQFGFTAEIEAYKNLYLGLSFDYSNQGIGKTASDLLSQFNAGMSAAAQAAAAQLDPEQWYEDLDRYSILFLFDYDTPIIENNDIALHFRGGVGLGVILIDGDPVENTFALDVESRLYANFLARPKIGLHLTFLEYFTTFFEVAYDFVPEDALTVEGTFFGSSRTKIEGDVDFSGFGVFGGFGFIW